MPAYNLELFGGRFHSDLWFALAWGAFPVVTGYVACAGIARGSRPSSPRRGRPSLSLAQRRLSTPVRRVRREVVAVDGELGARGRRHASRSRASSLVAAPEAALRLLTIATVLIAAALVAVRL